MQKRIKMLREQLGYSQEAFAKEVGLTKNYISLVENGKRTFAERTLKDICRKFDVREEWLRSGVGEMFIERLPEDEYTRAALMLKKDNDKLAMQAVVEYWKLSPQSKAAIKEYIMNIASKLKEEE